VSETYVALPFSRDEYARRVAAVRASMKEENLDALLLSIPQNYFYLTGFESGASYALFFLLLPREDDPLWIMRRTELTNLEHLAPLMWAKEGVGIDDSEDPIAVVIRELRTRGLGTARIGVEEESLVYTIKHNRQLVEGLREARFIDCTGLVEDVRRIKTEAELVYMRKAGKIASDGIQASFEALAEGVTEAELAAVMLDTAIRAGSGRVATLPFISSGPRTYRAHGIWSDRPIARGELVNAELAASCRNYHVPVFRSFSIGQPSDEIQRIHEVSEIGMHAGLEGIKPGMTSHEADAVVRAAINGEGYGDAFIVRAAYGLGSSFVPGWGEASVMTIRPKDERIIQPGMCFHLVPALYVRDVGCVCCSMPIEITSAGVRRLSSLEPKLFVH
jgi:Xaa-Pro dipeptidase